MHKEKREKDFELTVSNLNNMPEYVVGIVSSAGGPSILKKIIKGIDNQNIAILVAQHMSEGFLSNFAQWLKKETSREVKVAKQGEGIEKGKIYFPPDGYHIKLSKSRIELLRRPPIKGIRPSGDLLLKSIAESYRKRSIGVILTGMGSDGTSGIAEILKYGGITIAQSEESAFVNSMPKKAIESGLIKYVLSPEKIAKFLSKIEVR